MIFKGQTQGRAPFHASYFHKNIKFNLEWPIKVMFNITHIFQTYQYVSEMVELGVVGRNFLYATLQFCGQVGFPVDQAFLLSCPYMCVYLSACLLTKYLKNILINQAFWWEFLL